MALSNNFYNFEVVRERPEPLSDKWFDLLELTKKTPRLLFSRLGDNLHLKLTHPLIQSITLISLIDGEIIDHPNLKGDNLAKMREILTLEMRDIPGSDIVRWTKSPKTLPTKSVETATPTWVKNG